MIVHHNKTQSYDNEVLTEHEDVNFSSSRFQTVLVHGEHTGECMVSSSGSVCKFVTQVLVLICPTGERVPCFTCSVSLGLVLEEQGFGSHVSALDTAFWSSCTLVHRRTAFTD